MRALDGASSSSDDSDDPLNDSMSLYQDGPVTTASPAKHNAPPLHPLPFGTPGTGRSDRSERRKSSERETPHFSDTGTFQSTSFLIDAGGYRPSPASSGKHGNGKVDPVLFGRERSSSASSAASCGGGGGGGGSSRSGRGSSGGGGGGGSSNNLKRDLANQEDHRRSSAACESKLGGRRSSFDDESDSSDRMSVRSVSPLNDRTPSTASHRASPSRKLSTEFVELYELGRGAGGRVFKAIHVPTLRPVALKRIKCNTEQKMTSLGQEVSALAINYVPLDAFADGFVGGLLHGELSQTRDACMTRTVWAGNWSTPAAWRVEGGGSVSWTECA